MNRRAFVLLMSALVLLTSGCANLRFMNSQNKIPETFLATCAKLKVTPTKFILVVHISSQRLSLFEDGKFMKTFSCSTSRFGIGEQKDSNRTPRGLHRIAEKIGAGEPAGTVFQSREAVGHTSDAKFTAAGITTRIMWLDGLEPGFNQGGDVDTYARYVYIHGTSDQASLGRPASHGCIHLADADLIPLFDLLPVGTLVWIQLP
jgi:lipoprotein-anchoring transpeptidase ErfK/SrfK